MKVSPGLLSALPVGVHILELMRAEGGAVGPARVNYTRPEAQRKAWLELELCLGTRIMSDRQLPCP